MNTAELQAKGEQTVLFGKAGRDMDRSELLAALGRAAENNRNLIARHCPTPAFEFGQTVYLKLQQERGEVVPGMVTGIYMRPGLITYGISWADDRRESSHYQIELVAEGDDQ